MRANKRHETSNKLIGSGIANGPCSGATKEPKTGHCAESPFTLITLQLCHFSDTFFSSITYTWAVQNI